MRHSTLLLLAFASIAFNTSAQDKKQDTRTDKQVLLDELHIKTLRRGADTALSNHMDSNGLFGPIPDVLRLKNGKKVTTAKQWTKLRRPEIMEDFDREIYGRIPQNTPKVTWKVADVQKTTHGNTPVIIKTLLGHVDNSIDTAIKVDIQLVITIPASEKKPVPVLMELSFPEDYYQIKDTPGHKPSWQQQVLNKGWAYAMLLPVSIQPDHGNGLTKGIIGLMNKGGHRKPEDWGAVKAWAWGASRALDYIETDNMLDAKRVGMEGHSRYGKTVLVAMAYDPRFAIVYSSSSGEGGAKLHRHNMGEQVENITSSGAYHWTAGNFLKYAGPLHSTDIPVDAHELIALCAPRPVFIGVGANGDEWADPVGTFMAAVAAGPVYKLLGKEDLGTTTYPAVDSAIISGDLAFRLHHGGHTPALNWPSFIEFVSKYWK